MKAEGGRRKERAARVILHPSSFILLGALAGAPAMAQALTDPTRPPGETAAEAPAVAGAASPVNRLQSVIISPARKAAIINGVVVELGGKYGDAVLTKVAEDEVVLTRDSSQEVLKLFPAVEKIEITPRTVKGAPGKTIPNASQSPNPAAGGTRTR
jgi:hypothetical protein